MNLENGLQIDYYTQNDQDIGFKCDVCALTFPVISERNNHILNHFQQKNCSMCSDTLIRLGNIWYSIREHPDHNDNKTEINSNGSDNKCTSEPVFVEALKSEPDPIHNEQTETQFDESFTAIDNDDSPVEAEDDSTNYHSDFVRVPDSTEQKPLDIADDPDKINDSQETLRDTPTKDQCHICMKKMSSSSKLKYHMNLHLGLKPFVCEHCGKAFAYKDSLNTHKKIHSETNALANMDDANLAILKTIDPKKFKLTPKQIKSLICPICSKKLPSKVGLNGHMLAHRTPKYQCKLCTITFHTVDKYRAHKSAVHDETQYNIKDFRYDDSMAERESENTDWVCEYCNADFKLENYLAKHILKDHDDKKSEHDCNICVEKFSSLGELLVHKRAHPESIQYKCTFDGCEHEFAYKVKLSAHLAKHRLIDGLIIRKTQDDIRPAMIQHAAYRLSGFGSKNNGAPDEDLICNICSKKYPTQTAVQQHIQAEHKNERIKCLAEGCDKIFKRKNGGLTNHIKNFHPELIRECDTCKKVFYSDAKLLEHQRRHNSYACDLCPKVFTWKHHLVVHMTKHEKEAKCEICNLKFHSVKQMKIHRECHINKKIIKCRYPGCNQSFESRREFMRHTIQQHPDNQRNKPVCPYCGKAITNSFFKDHLNIHTGETPHECLICKKKFSGARSLARHKMIHTGEKPYVCDVDGCSQAYRDSIDLKRHKFGVHKIYTKKHICSICSKVFPERKLLRNHTLKVHDKVNHESSPKID